MVAVQDVCVSFGSFDLLKNLSFLINEHDRIGLTGKNGSGKSTLLKIIAGIQNPTTGVIDMSGDVTIGYLPQQMRVDDNTTVWHETVSAFSDLINLSEEIEKYSKEIASRADYESVEYMRLCDFLTVSEERFRMLGGSDYIAETELALTGLGFEREDFERPTGELSGGWRMRIELAKMLLKKPSLLLLDEPTNHLDIHSKDILKQALMKYDGTLIVVSHDRDFLDGLVQKVYEFRNKTVKENIGGIYDFLRKKKIKDLRDIELKDKSVNVVISDNISVNKQRYFDKKEYDRNLRKLRKRLKDSEKHIEKMEAELMDMDKIIANPDHPACSDADIYTNYNLLRERLNKEMNNWVSFYHEVEDFLRKNPE
jgi:ATP-binding cassette subfamily F protein 3